MKLLCGVGVLTAVLCVSGQNARLLGQKAALKVTVLTQSPADTTTELQIFCLFRSTPVNALHGSLVETDEKLHGLLGQIRKPGLFGGELGETILMVPPAGTLAAKKVLVVGLGDPAAFTLDRMELVGKISFRESNRLGVAHPFFTPTLLDGGVTRYRTGEVAEQVVRGFLEALATESALRAAGAAGPLTVVDLTFLAGAKNAVDTQSGIDRALGIAATVSR